MEKVTWFCSMCPHENIVSHRSIDTHPTCPTCKTVHTWTQLVYLGDDQDAYLNSIDDLSRKLLGKIAVDIVEEQDDSAVHCLQNCFNSSVLPELAIQRLIDLNIKNKGYQKAAALEGKAEKLNGNSDAEHLEKQALLQEACNYRDWAEFQYVTSNLDWTPTF